MTQKNLKPLKEKIEKHYDHLHKKYPLTRLILGSIETLLKIDATDDLVSSWYSSSMICIREIEKEIRELESDK